jgi:glucose-6-phosphate-specific signal transduction histidine kinase
LRVADSRHGIKGQRRKPQPKKRSGEITNQLHIQISDDGSGLPSDYTYGIGLLSMRERAQELGGVFEIESQPGQGTTVRATLPIVSPKEPV